MAESTTSKPNAPVKVDNIEQASSNFYWTYETEKQIFNLQTTIRGILTYEQIQAHIKSVLEATAHVYQLGGQAKQVGRGAPEIPAAPLPETVQPVAPLPESVPIQTAPVDIVPTPEYVPVDEGVKQPNTDTFDAKLLVVTITNGKKYFRIKGGRWMPYGVTVWDEVLASVNINPGNLTSTVKPYDMTEYRATCTLKADGKPIKVIKLERINP